MPSVYNQYIKNHSGKKAIQSSLRVGNAGEAVVILWILSAFVFIYSSVGSLFYGLFVLLKPPGSYIEGGSQGTFVTVHTILQYINLGSLITYFTTFTIIIYALAI